MTKLLPLASLALVLLATQTVRAQTTLSVDQPSLVFTAEVSGPPTSLSLNVTSSPASAVVLATAVEQSGTQVTWLSVSPAAGATPLTVTVTVNPANLTAGSYKGSIVVSPFGGTGSSVTVPVSLTVSVINVFPSSLSFSTSVGLTPAATSVTLAAAQMVSFSASAATTTGGNWLLVSPPFGVISTGSSAVSAVPNSSVVPSLTPGTYSGSITITPTSGTSLTPVVVPVTLTVTASPDVTVSPTTVNLQYQIGGSANNPQQTVILTTSSTQGVQYTISATSQPNPSGGVWVLPNPLFGTITSSGTPVTIGYNSAASLPAGGYVSTVTINTPNGSPTSTDITVNLLVATQPLLTVPGTALNFTYELGSAAPPAQSVTITSTSGATQNYTVAVSTTDGAAWLVAPTTGSTAGPLNVSISPSGLAPGAYTGTVTVTGVGTANGAQKIPVNLKVAEDPAIVTNLTSVALAYQIGQTQSVSQAIALGSTTGLPLTFSVTASGGNCGSSWLTVSGASGTTPAQVTLAISPQGLAAGVCSGTLSVAATNPQTGVAAINSPLSIPVKLTVSSSALLVVSPATPAVFTGLASGASPASQSFTFGSTDSNLLTFTAGAATNNGGSWLQVSPLSGATTSGSNKLTVSVQTGQLAAGTYTGAVTVTATAPGGAAVLNSPLTIPVTFLVTSGSLVLSQTSLSFQQAVGGPAPASQTVSVTSSGQPLQFAAAAANTGSVNWLSVTSSGSTPGSISVSADGSKLALGTYNGTVSVLSTIANAGNSPAVLPVTLTMNAGTLSAVPTSLTFTQVQGGPAPAAQSVTVSGTPGPISFQAAASGATWLTVSPASGSTPSTLQVAIAANSLAVGSYAGTLTISATGALGSPIAIPVTLNVVVPHALTVNPTTLTFTATPGSTTTSFAPLAVTSAGGSAPYSLAVAGGSWLSAKPASGTTPATATVTVDPTGLAVAAYSGTVTVSSPNSIYPVAVTVNLVVGKPTPPAMSAIANAASYGTGGLAPGENVVIYGVNIGPPQITGGTVTNGVVDTAVAATRVLFDGIAAPIIYVSSGQSSVMVPYELTGRTTTSVVAEYQGVQSAAVAYSVTPTLPGIYTQNSQGFGPGAIRNQDYSLNQPINPAARNSVVSVYMTGEGYIVGAVDGAIATGLLSPVLPVTATVGGLPATVTYVGTAPGIVTGATQVNVQIPANAPTGSSVPIVITVGSGVTAVNTQVGVTVAVQ